jgi:hypothetical protein
VTESEEIKALRVKVLWLESQIRALMAWRNRVERAERERAR